MEIIILTLLGAGIFFTATKLKTPTPELGQYQYRYAGFWVRLFAWVIDAIVMQVILYSFYYSFLRVLFDPAFLDQDSFTTQLLSSSEVFTVNGILSVSFLVPLIYFAGFESSPLQATLGKMLFGLKVTDLEGGRISFLGAVGRYLGKLLSGLFFCLGYIMVAFSRKKQGLHDHIASTLVIGSITLVAQFPKAQEQAPQGKEQTPNLQSGFDLDALLSEEPQEGSEPLKTQPPAAVRSPWDLQKKTETLAAGESPWAMGANKANEAESQPEQTSTSEPTPEPPPEAATSKETPPERDPNDRFRPDSPHNPDRPKS